MIPLLKKFTSNSVIYDSVGSDTQSYISMYNDGRYIYFLKDQSGTVSILDTFTEQTSSANAIVDNTEQINSIIVKDGVVYGYEGFDAKEFGNNSVLYIRNTDELVEESVNHSSSIRTLTGARAVKVTHLSSSTDILDFAIDESDNYYVIHGVNKISKFDKHRVPQFKLEIDRNTGTLLTDLQLQLTDKIELLKLDFVHEYADNRKSDYPIILGSITTTEKLFLARFDESFTTIVAAKYIGIDGSVADSYESDRKIRYNLTNHDYLRRTYRESNQITFSVILLNRYNNNEKTEIRIPIDTSTFTSDSHHFALKMDSANGVVSVYMDGVIHDSVQIDASKYLFQDILNDDIVIGTTNFYNKTTLAEYIGKSGSYMTNDANIKNFRIYNKSLSDNEIKFTMYNSLDMTDLVTSLPAGQINQIETIDTQFKLSIPGFKSNSVNIFVKNTEELTISEKTKLVDVLNDKLTKVIPETTKINDIEFR